MSAENLSPSVELVNTILTKHHHLTVRMMMSVLVLVQVFAVVMCIMYHGRGNQVVQLKNQVVQLKQQVLHMQDKVVAAQDRIQILSIPDETQVSRVRRCSQ